MNQKTVDNFRTVVLDYYHKAGRHDLPWRRAEAEGTFDPYKIVVSEVMLQQTQVSRVLPKFQTFIERFPDFTTLARAPLSDVLIAWSGLGYNRRAKFLWQLAGSVMKRHKGQLPGDIETLVQLPGIGVNTAGAIAAYAFNRPVVFIETNIRTVYIHHFLNDKQKVDDKQLTPLIEETLLPNDSRIWYWALMDYGTYLKQTVGNISRASKVYAKQSVFAGSRRQIRGAVLRLLTIEALQLSDLTKHLPDERLEAVLHDLQREELIDFTDPWYRLRT